MMRLGETKTKFRYPAEEECIVRRLGSAVILSWSELPAEIRAKILAEARVTWDREFYVPKLMDRLSSMATRFC